MTLLTFDLVKDRTINGVGVCSASIFQNRKIFEYRVDDVCGHEYGYGAVFDSRDSAVDAMFGAFDPRAA